MQSLVKKLGPGLDKPNEPVPDDNAPKDAQEGYVAEYVRSSLKVALPTFKKIMSNAGMFAAL
jgi:hypothetical protein